MEKWAAKELSQVDLGDASRNKRLIRLVKNLAFAIVAAITIPMLLVWQ
ncbi:hypothetical protein H6F77_18510 [Microcoleus sp. FACHB-831]|nr:transposase DNA-binding-containing protein [Microcoleus sp. FACHB-831]MBD1923047.1 hypothetical protein [Microcoleus sp. FACHB-831]